LAVPAGRPSAGPPFARWALQGVRARRGLPSQPRIREELAPEAHRRERLAVFDRMTGAGADAARPPRPAVPGSAARRGGGPSASPSPASTLPRGATPYAVDRALPAPTLAPWMRPVAATPPHPSTGATARLPRGLVNAGLGFVDAQLRTDVRAAIEPTGKDLSPRRQGPCASTRSSGQPAQRGFDNRESRLASSPAVPNPVDSACLPVAHRRPPSGSRIQPN
jgi:hypothetical protein